MFKYGWYKYGLCFMLLTFFLFDMASGKITGGFVSTTENTAVDDLNSKNTLLVTGAIVAEKSQVFSTPKTDTFKMKIEWMMEEGEIARPGDLVVLFDGSSLVSEIEQQQSKLEETEESAKKAVAQKEQDWLEAEYGIKKAINQLAKANVDAAIPKKFLSDFDYENFALEKQRFEKELEKSRQNSVNKKKALDDEVKKQLLEIQKIQDTLARKKQILKAMKLTAELNGPVIYSTNHRGDKIRTGDSVYMGQNVALIPFMQQLKVEAWVNEVDIHKIGKGQKVRMNLDAYPEDFFYGRIGEISKQAEEKQSWGWASYFNVEMIPEQQPRNNVLPSMSVRAEIFLEENVSHE